QGLYAADVVQYYGDNVPNFTQGEWNNVAKSLPDYAYDVASKDAVLNMSVVDGRIFLPDGMNYKVLVLPDVAWMDYFLLQKISTLVKDGATIIGSRPKRISGVPNFPTADANVDAESKRVVDELWGADVSVTKIRRVGKGRVVCGMTATDILRNDNLLPDVKRLRGSLPDGQHRIKWIHRTLHNDSIVGGKLSDFSPIKFALTPKTTPQLAMNNTNRTEIYFVANLVAKPDKTEIAFRVTQKQPEIWDAVSGTIADAKSFRQENGQTIVPLELAASGSVFVVFRKPIASGANGVDGDNSIRFEGERILDGDWKVKFDSGRGISVPVIFTQLIDWTKHADERIKYYSGAAVYQKEFSYKKSAADERVYLELDLVREMARVRINGKEICTLWARPFRVDVTESIREGNNIVELEVVNHWANRIIGDAKLPESQRQTQTNIRRLTAKTPLVESGLIGNVKLKISRP
ncbi:MAG: hypothetical protein LBT09_12770, partial [Planctomycetaceae bacterium]|nr:hypothetical protein [Planctomycetaceae bacterium]